MPPIACVYSIGELATELIALHGILEGFFSHAGAFTLCEVRVTLPGESPLRGDSQGGDPSGRATVINGLDGQVRLTFFSYQRAI